MAEYIDREAAANIFSRARSAMRPEDYRTFDEMNTRDLMLLNAEQAIRLLPAADVVEVRHGHWIRREGFDYENNVILGACSKCDWEVKDFTNYCPNCGAKMESEE